MQHKDCLLKPNGVDGTVGTTRVVFNNLKHAGAPKSFQHLRRIMLFPVLSKMQSMSEELPHSSWEPHQISLAASNPD
jgi:hypothetical protein